MTFWPRITTDSGEHRKIYGVHEYEYNRAILERAQELKQETKEAKEEKQ